MPKHVVEWNYSPCDSQKANSSRWNGDNPNIPLVSSVHLSLCKHHFLRYPPFFKNTTSWGKRASTHRLSNVNCNNACHPIVMHPPSPQNYLCYKVSYGKPQTPPAIAKALHCSLWNDDKALLPKTTPVSRWTRKI